MIVECDRCHAKYHYDEARFGGKPSKKLRCSRCQAIFEISNTHAYEVQPPLRPPIASGDTVIRRSRPAGEAEARRDTPGPDGRPAAEPSRGAAPGLRLPDSARLSLAVIAGPDAGKMFVVDKPRVLIGREDVDLALDDTEVSRQHAAIEVRGDSVVLLDLGSTNGTLVGEDPVSEAPLENQSEFTVGGSTIMLIVTPV